MHTVTSGQLSLTYSSDFSGEAFLTLEGATSTAQMKVTGSEVRDLIRKLTDKHPDIRPDMLLLIGTYPDGGDVILGVFASVAGARVGRDKHGEEHSGLLMTYRIDAWSPED